MAIDSNLLTNLGLLGLTGAAGYFPTPANSNSTTTGSGTNTSNGSTQAQQIEQGVNNTQSNQQNITSGTQQSSQNGTNFQNNLNNAFGSNTQTSTPNIQPGAQSLIDNLMSMYKTNLTTIPGQVQAIKSKQIADINKQGFAQRNLVNEIMAARGISQSPASGIAESNVENDRIGKINEFQQSLPLVESQLRNQAMTAAGNFATSVPYGQTTTGQNQQQQTGQSQGGTSQQGLTNTSGRSDAGTQQFNQTYNSVNSQGSSQNQTSNSSNQNTSGVSETGGGTGGLITGIASALAELLKFKNPNSTTQPTTPAQPNPANPTNAGGTDENGIDWGKLGTTLAGSLAGIFGGIFGGKSKNDKGDTTTNPSDPSSPPVLIDRSPVDNPPPVNVPPEQQPTIPIPPIIQLPPSTPDAPVEQPPTPPVEQVDSTITYDPTPPIIPEIPPVRNEGSTTETVGTGRGRDNPPQQPPIQQPTEQVNSTINYPDIPPFVPPVPVYEPPPPSIPEPQGTADSTIYYPDNGGGGSNPVNNDPWGGPQGDPGPWGGNQNPWPNDGEDPNSPPGSIMIGPNGEIIELGPGGSTPGNYQDYSEGYWPTEVNQGGFNTPGGGGYVTDQDRSMFPGMSDEEIMSMKIAAPWAFQG